MSISSIIAEIDVEISHLEQARVVLSSLDSTAIEEVSAHAKKVVTKRRRLSTKARAAIAAAQKKRWAAVHAAEGKKAKSKVPF
jgi:hypothetical protein